MAVEAHNLNLFSPQFLINRQMMNPIEANSSLYNTQMGYGLPLSETPQPPMYSSFIPDSYPQAIKSENNSGITYNNNNNIHLSRKRPRESFSFLGNDISFHLQQQQFDIDHLISQHMEKVRIEIDERRKKQARKIMEVVEGTVMNKLRTKEEEIEKIRRINWALEERVKSLYMENQIWRDLAQTNEATANALRTDLEQILTAQNEDHHHQQNQLNQNDTGLEQVLIDDAQSCCGSNYEEDADNTISSRLCRNCKKTESSVLLLPCRHLCLCYVCGSSLNICPICKSSKTASLHVNMS